MQYKRIRELREDHDKTQEYIAKMLDEHLTTYRRWETGETETPAHIIKKLALYYNITADYILEITDEQRKIQKYIMKFNERIRDLREDKDLTQTEVGKILNMSQRKISRLETGETEPTTDEIILFCKFYKQSADYLLGLKDK